MVETIGERKYEQSFDAVLKLSCCHSSRLGCQIVLTDELDGLVVGLPDYPDWEIP